MGIKERITRLEQKAGETGNLSLIPPQERVVAIPAYTDEEYEIEERRRLSALHERYGDFPDDGLLFIHIRKFAQSS